MSGLTQGDVVNLRKIEKSLNEKATVLKNFDNDILELIDEADVDTKTHQICLTRQTKLSLKSNIC